ncbi:MAG: hypothetical protein PWR14_612 [Thermosediminibacterales bacterium]|nr:hypothetical protein [Thermosediminibacterales bacterium]
MGIKTLQDKFYKLKNIQFDNPTINLWAVTDRTLRNKKASYKTKSINTRDELKTKLYNIVLKVIEKSGKVIEYEDLTVDQDDDVLYIESEITDFELILVDINKGSDAEKVKNIDELKNTWAYVIEIQDDKNRVLGVKKLSKEWDMTKNNFINLIFQQQEFVDLNESSIFKIYNSLDFLWFDGGLYIFDKRNFEKALNFRERLIKSKNEVLEDIKKENILDDVDLLKDSVGENMKYLRKLSQIKKNGYYKFPNYIANLKIVNKQEKWGLRIENDKIIVEEDKIDLILTVLNNGRLKSLVTFETFDVDTKKKVS